MTDKKLLSICIPTYNRATYLDQAIASIVDQIDDSLKNYIEICISDNASTDSTPKIVQSWIEKNLVEIKYYINTINEGADKNFLKAIDIATGEYCWFLASDDKIEVGALRDILSKIKEHLNVDIFILCQYGYNKDFSKKILLGTHPLLHNKSDVLFSTSQEAIDSVSYILGYLSILLFRKSDWDKVQGFEKYIGSAYVHVYKILLMIASGANTMFLRKECIGWRSDNDSFLKDLKLFGRIKIDVEGYYNIASDIFGEYSPEHNSIVNQIIKIHCKGHIMSLKSRKESFSMQFQIFRLYFKYYKYFLNFWLKLVPLFLIPGWAYHCIRFVYRKTIKKYYLNKLESQQWGRE